MNFLTRPFAFCVLDQDLRRYVVDASGVEISPITINLGSSERLTDGLRYTMWMTCPPGIPNLRSQRLLAQFDDFAGVTGKDTEETRT